MGDSLLNQAIDGKFSLGKTLIDGLIGSAMGGMFHGLGSLAKKFSPYIKSGIGKVLGKLSSGAKNILGKISEKAGNLVSAFKNTCKNLFEKTSNKFRNVVSAIKNSGRELYQKVSSKINEVVSDIKNSARNLYEEVSEKIYESSEKFNEVAQKIDNKLEEVLPDSVKTARDNFRRNLGLDDPQFAFEGGPNNYFDEENNNFYNQINRIEGNSHSTGKNPLSPAERAANKGFKGIKTTENGGPDFSASKYIKRTEDGEPIIATIEMSGSRSKDFTRAFDDVGIPANERKKILEDYTWHHVDDYDEATGKCTMQLVEKKAHEATYPHRGSCAQYDSIHGETYNRKYKGKTPKEKAADNGFEINETENGGADFKDTDYIYTLDSGKQASTHIKMSGSKSQDTKELYKKLGISEEEQEVLEENYRVYYLDDFDPDTGECTIQLVDRDAADIVKNYAGAQAQYKANNHVKYYKN